jgi:hypothetical protein
MGNEGIGGPMPHQLSPSACNDLTRELEMGKNRLHVYLLQEPDNPLAMWWDIHIRILTWLLLRYGDQPIARPILPPTMHPCWFCAYSLPECGKPPRSAEQIREVLHRIAEANRSESLRLEPSSNRDEMRS